MNLATTFLVYTVIGAATAGAILLRHDRAATGERIFRAVTAIVFWPLYLPLLLQGSAPMHVSTVAVKRPGLERELADAIDQVEAELDLALGSLDGWSDAVLLREQRRFAELRGAWRQQAGRITELDRLLGQLEASRGPAEVHPPAARIAASESARRDNLNRLRALRCRLQEDLLSTLARVRELVTMIHLARFTGAPVARAEELVAQIADAVAGLTEAAAWQEGVGAA
jgi:hypothetical protein